MKSIIYLTTPTSATASMWRILTRIARDKYECVHFVDSFYQTGRLAELNSAIPPKEGKLLQFNVPHMFNKNLDLSDYRFIFNMRDPRDLGCNQYYWALQHPAPNKTDEELALTRSKIESEGIDKFVLSKNYNPMFEAIIDVYNRAAPEDKLLSSYAKLCLDFDSFIKDTANFLNVELTNDILEDLKPERIENINDNQSWIGTQWKGSDVLPGRHKSELNKETIEVINTRYEQILSFLYNHDVETTKSTYVP